MSDKEMMQKNIEEFARLQKYMLLVESKESAVYKEMKDRNYLLFDVWVKLRALLGFYMCFNKFYIQLLFGVMNHTFFDNTPAVSFQTLF